MPNHLKIHVVRINDRIHTKLKNTNMQFPIGDNFSVVSNLTVKFTDSKYETSEDSNILERDVG
jgi:hypothetical protein